MLDEISYVGVADALGEAVDDVRAMGLVCRLGTIEAIKQVRERRLHSEVVTAIRFCNQFVEVVSIEVMVQDFAPFTIDAD